MNKYFLKEELLHSVCYFQAANYYLGAPGQHPSVAFEKTMIRDLLLKQPELQNVYENLLKDCENNELYSSTFPELFANKILIENFTEQLFTKHYKCEDDRQRTKVFARILKNYPPFFSILHDFIKNNPEKSDSALYGFYFKSLSNEIIKENNISREEVISLIDTFDVNKEESFKSKKLNAYLTLNPKNIDLYNHIIEVMGDSIANNGKIKAIWEEGIKDFDAECQKQYKNKNISISPAMDEEGYHYMFKINPEYIIEKSKIHETKTDRFNRALHNSISDLVSSNFSYIKKFNQNNPAVEFTFSSIDDKNEVKKFCNFVLKDLDYLINQVNFNNSYDEHEKFCKIYLDKVNLAYSLDDELNPNQKINKIKSKI